MHKARTAALTAVIAAAAAAATMAVPATLTSAAASASAAGSAASAAVNVTVRPAAIRLPGAPRQAPPTTAQCKKLDGIACFNPNQLRAAYHLPALYAQGVTGKGQTIMIVDSFGSPTIKADLAAFDKQFGYPAPPNFTVIAPVGKITKFDPSWAGETTLDVEYAHALAPGANILLVETPVSETEGVTGFPQIVAAEKYAMAHYKVSVISQSFGATEQTFPNTKLPAALRAAYTDAASRKVTVLAASGDGGATDYKSDQVSYYTSRVTSWPDSDPLVTAIGGTQLKQTAAGYKSVAWNDTYDQAWQLYASGSVDPNPVASGGGKSAFFARPAFQNSVKAVAGTRRGVPDISMSAACDGAVDTYSSYGGAAGWTLTCGTSEATPEFAAIVALADQVAGHRLGNINAALYKLSARHVPGIVDVTSGNNTVSFFQGTSVNPVKVKGYAATKGYDLVTGVGTVSAPAFVHELAGK
ncbi:protease [Trebonia kvetii]|uniref:Protease n=1 Tax=Trebonia kvetii TaxID=2480626 RepID=A0A6P2BV57_9ACTN|nr:S53 family peptidase [Trebonia kvetii]TVZ02944.1 protease [Trebonia kvetii]